MMIPATMEKTIMMMIAGQQVAKDFIMAAVLSNSASGSRTTHAIPGLLIIDTYR